MKIRPGGPGDTAAVLAHGDEAVRWMNARGMAWSSAREKYGFSRVQESTVALPAGHGRARCSRCHCRGGDLG